jgi:hypothetical protein
MLIRGKTLKLGLAALAATTLIACGGGSGGGSSSAASSKSGEVAGPLDALQVPRSEQVIGNIAALTTDTPLEPLLSCVDEAVVGDLLDVVDSLAVAAEEAVASGDPTAAFQLAAANIQAQVEQFVGNATQLVTSLAGGEGCLGGGLPSGGLPTGGLPSTGTPLDSLTSILAGSAGGFAPGTDLPTLSANSTGLADQFNAAFANVPAELQGAPVVGGVLMLLSDAVNDLDSLLSALAGMQPAVAAAAAEELIANVLSNLLLGVVPVATLEGAAGQNGAVSGPVQAGIDQATAAIGDGLAAILDPLATVGGGGAGGPTGTPLDAILAPLTDVLNSGGLPSLPGGGGSGGPTGTPLDAILAPLTDLIGSGGLPSLPGASSTGTPLDALLEPLLALLPADAGTLDPLSLAAILVDALNGQGPLGVVTSPAQVVLDPIRDALQQAGLQGIVQDQVLHSSVADLLLGTLLGLL